MVDLNDDSSFASDLIELILHSKIFSGIDRKACEFLLPRLERIFLPQGDILFEQGDASDCLYILVDGQLIALLQTKESKQKVVGTVEKGETVGELGALSNQPRSLTIRAAVDSRLLKLPRKEFEVFCKEQPNFIARIIDLIIERSQNTLKVISQNKLYRHIAIIKANDQAPLAPFMSKLKENFPKNTKYILLEKPPENISIGEFMNQAEQEGNSVIFVLEEKNLQEIQLKLNHIGGIFVVTDGDIPTMFSDFSLNMLSRRRTPFCTQYELVLVHDDHVQMPTGTIEWLLQAKFTLHHHINVSKDTDYQRLLRFMMGRAIGLVLSGGGHKGWAAVGAIKALIDANIPIDAIGGASVGALVGSCFLKHLAYHETFHSFKELTQSLANPFSLKNLTWPLISILNAKAPTESLQALFQNVNIEDLWLPFFAVTSNVTRGCEVVHHQGSLWEVLRGSSAVPGIAPPMVLDGELHYDGGLLNNLPTDHMRTLLGSDATIIAVTLSGFNEKPKQYHFPPIIPFWLAVKKKLKLGHKQYKFPPFFITFLNALLLGSSAKEKANMLIADIVISPNLNEYRVMNLKVTGIHGMVEIGYKTTQEQIKSFKFPY
ncbi:MAG: patatin-like phospholipase family protein [Gammaproteobacteria bacterium]